MSYCCDKDPIILFSCHSGRGRMTPSRKDPNPRSQCLNGLCLQNRVSYLQKQLQGLSLLTLLGILSHYISTLLCFLQELKSKHYSWPTLMPVDSGRRDVNSSVFIACLFQICMNVSNVGKKRSVWIINVNVPHFKTFLLCPLLLPVFADLHWLCLTRFPSISCITQQDSQTACISIKLSCQPPLSRDTCFTHPSSPLLLKYIYYHPSCTFSFLCFRKL